MDAQAVQSPDNLHFKLLRLIDTVTLYQSSVVEEIIDHLLTLDAERSLVDLFTELSAGIFLGITANPTRPAIRQMSLWQDQITLWQYGVRTLLGVTATAVATPDADDMRFRDPLWCSNVGFDLLKQSYLLWAKHVQFLVDDFDGLEPRRRKRLGYFTRQLINALAPTNFPLTNPEVLRKTLETNGDNLVSGLRLLLEDHRHSSGILNVCMSQPGAFELGRDIACTAGYVVAENRLMQLIQYSPQTEQVYRVPILIVPSWINKYYILDLTPKTSFIQWLVAQGYTVFVISWINPDATHCEAGFADYMSQGPLAAVAVIERLTGEPQVAAIGYCLGGVLLASTVAYGDVAGERRFASATYLAASIDFSDPGDMGMFIDEETVEELEEEMSEQGYLDGRLLAVGFNLLRENDLYWSYYVTNYLKGERPPALHLLHWNTDSTHIPAATHSFVLRELHLHNRLMQPGGVVLNGRSIDLRNIETPTYILGTEKDHIAQWRSTYTAVLLQRGPVRFVLAGSGHINGVINPPWQEKYYFYVNDNIAQTADLWFADARKETGSWWSDWHAWQQRLAGDRVCARHIDPDAAIEPAPGRYVRRRIVQGTAVAPDESGGAFGVGGGR